MGGGGGGVFMVHTIRLLSATPSARFPKICDFFYLPSGNFVTELKEDWFRGGAAVIIQTRGHEEIDTYNCFLMIDKICKRT